MTCEACFDFLEKFGVLSLFPFVNDCSKCLKGKVKTITVFGLNRSLFNFIY